MVLVPLSVYEYAGSLRIMAHIWLKSEILGKSIPLRAIVDTGSPVTMVGPLDINRMRISTLKLKGIEARNNPVNIGGGQMITKVLDDTSLKFMNGFEVKLPVEFPVEGKNNPNQPSLLGVDFLLKTGAKLIFNPKEREAYFEIS